MIGKSTFEFMKAHRSHECRVWESCRPTLMEFMSFQRKSNPLKSISAQGLFLSFSLDSSSTKVAYLLNAGCFTFKDICQQVSFILFYNV